MAGSLKTTIKIGSQPTKGYFRTVRGSDNAAFGVRNNAVYAKNTQSRMGREIAAQLAASTLYQAGRERFFKEERKVLVTAIRHGANVEARRLTDFIATQMIGSAGGRFGVTWRSGFMMAGAKKPIGWKSAVPMDGQIEWAQLSLGWMYQKRQDLFFRHTGDLKRAVRAMRTSYPQSLGGINVREKDMTKSAMSKLRREAGDPGESHFRRVVLGSIEIEIFPRATPSLFPGLLTGKWDQIDTRAALEASQFVPSRIRDKLSGPRRGGHPYRFRPMLGPATQFWMMHRIPAAIATAINNGTRKRDRSDDWMR